VRVVVLTYCRNAALLYGTLLVFKTIRVGFPNAEIHVVDNCSLPETRQAIEELARANGCKFRQFHKEVAHHDFIEYVLNTFTGTVVFLDPDVVFWEACEHWSFPQLMAGRLIPRFQDEFSGTVTRERLHTSFLWVQDSEALTGAIRALKARYWDFKPFQPFTFFEEGRWHRFDAGASLLAAIKDRCYVFGERELGAYDHIMLGSHLDVVMPRLSPADAERVQQAHAWAQGDFGRLRGIWRLQDEYFARRRVG